MKENLTEQELEFISMFDASENLHKCDICKDKGYLLNDNKEANTCVCQKKKELYHAYEEASIPKSFWHLNLKEHWNLNQDAFGDDLGVSKPIKKKVKMIMQFYIKNLEKVVDGEFLTIVNNELNFRIKLRSLLLVGGNNSGKTMLAAIVAKHAVELGMTVRYYDWNVDIVRNLINFDSREEQKSLIEDFTYLDLIIIDGLHDYGLEQKHFLFQLDSLIAAREKANKPMIITSDYNVKLKSGPVWDNYYNNELFRIELPTPKK